MTRDEYLKTKRVHTDLERLTDTASCLPHIHSPLLTFLIAERDFIQSIIVSSSKTTFFSLIYSSGQGDVSESVVWDFEKGFKKKKKEPFFLNCLGLKITFFLSSPAFLLLASYNMVAMAGTPAAIFDYEENLWMEMSFRDSKIETQNVLNVQTDPVEPP